LQEKVIELRNAPMKHTLLKKLNIISYWYLRAVNFESILKENVSGNELQG